ncbi:MAG: hypothetical protein CV090_06055, partial [Nitrospira sp. WS238]|nr:hypothetical protein [Nitrospira sp. WS238]
SLRTLTLYSAILGISTSVTGVLISALWDIPSGPAIVLLSTGIFFISIFVSPKRVKATSIARVH